VRECPNGSKIDAIVAVGGLIQLVEHCYCVSDTVVASQGSAVELASEAGVGSTYIVNQPLAARAKIALYPWNRRERELAQTIGFFACIWCSPRWA
jgi:hypothetical protein